MKKYLRLYFVCNYRNFIGNNYQNLFPIIKPTRCINFSNLLFELNSTCFGGQFPCPSSGVFHCTHSNCICHTGLLTACKQDQDGTTVNHDNFLTIKPTRCTNFSNFFSEWNSTCFGQFLCPSSGVFHCTHSSGMCHTGLLTACEQDQDGTVQNM